MKSVELEPAKAEPVWLSPDKLKAIELLLVQDTCRFKQEDIQTIKGVASTD